MHAKPVTHYSVTLLQYSVKFLYTLLYEVSTVESIRIYYDAPCETVYGMYLFGTEAPSAMMFGYTNMHPPLLVLLL